MRMVLLAASLGISTFAADSVPIYPGAEWEKIAKPESIKYSTQRLEALRAWLKASRSTAMTVVVGGRVLFEYGDVKLVSKVASVRKSILAMLYGRYVDDGTIDLRKTGKMGLWSALVGLGCAFMAWDGDGDRTPSGCLHGHGRIWAIHHSVTADGYGGHDQSGLRRTPGL